MRKKLDKLKRRELEVVVSLSLFVLIWTFLLLLLQLQNEIDRLKESLRSGDSSRISEELAHCQQVSVCVNGDVTGERDCLEIQRRESSTKAIGRGTRSSESTISTISKSTSADHGSEITCSAPTNSWISRSTSTRTDPAHSSSADSRQSAACRARSSRILSCSCSTDESRSDVFEFVSSRKQTTVPRRTRSIPRSEHQRGL